MKVIVSDTSCISNLLLIGKLELLKETYNNILIPPAVFSEVLALEEFGKSVEHFKQASWIEVVLMKAKKSGHLTTVNEVLDRLINEAGFRVSKKLYNHVLILVNEK